MQFLKNHYEKILLSLVLLGLVAAVAVLFIQVGNVKKELKEKELGGPVEHKEVEVRPHLEYEEALQKGTNPPPIDLVTGHRLLNPYRWVLDSQGKIIKVDAEDKLGAGAIQVVRVTNFNYVISFIRASGATYQFGTQREGMETRPRSVYLRVDDKKPVFYTDGTNASLALKEVKGEPANPTEVVVEFERPEASGGAITLTIKPDEPYTELMFRQADLMYPPENRPFNGVKVGDSLTLGGETYKVIAITDKQVIFEAANKKRTIINYPSTAP